MVRIEFLIWPNRNQWFPRNIQSFDQNAMHSTDNTRETNFQPTPYSPLLNSSPAVFYPDPLTFGELWNFGWGRADSHSAWFRESLIFFWRGIPIWAVWMKHYATRIQFVQSTLAIHSPIFMSETCRFKSPNCSPNRHCQRTSPTKHHHILFVQVQTIYFIYFILFSFLFRPS